MTWNMVIAVCAGLGSLGILGFTIFIFQGVSAPLPYQVQHRTIRSIKRPVS